MATKKRPTAPRTAVAVDGQADDFYKRLRARIAGWAERSRLPANAREYILALPDLVHLVSRLVLDRRVDALGKAILGVALAYALNPIDIIPDVLGPVGFLDDLLVVALALDNMLDRTPREVVRQYWAGSGDVYALVARTLDTADQWIGRGMYRRIREFMASHLGGKKPGASLPPPVPAGPRAAGRKAAPSGDPPARRKAVARVRPAVGEAKPPRSGAVRKTPTQRVGRAHAEKPEVDTPPSTGRPARAPRVAATTRSEAGQATSRRPRRR